MAFPENLRCFNNIKNYSRRAITRLVFLFIMNFHQTLSITAETREWREVFINKADVLEGNMKIYTNTHDLISASMLCLKTVSCSLICDDNGNWFLSDYQRSADYFQPFNDEQFRCFTSRPGKFKNL